jgi:hypothetical protein
MILAVVLIPPYCDPRGIWVIDGDTLRYFGEKYRNYRLRTRRLVPFVY